MILDKFFKRKPQITLSSRTVKLIEDLRVVAWFANVGQPALESARVVFVKDWNEAIAAFSEETFDDATREAQNLMARFYHETHPSGWNDVIDVLKPHIVSLAEEKISSAKEKGFCPPNLPSSILDLLLAVFYTECRDSLPEIEYYEEILHWYLAGHFPCGWVGEIPEDFEHSFRFGKLMVF